MTQPVSAGDEGDVGDVVATHLPHAVGDLEQPVMGCSAGHVATGWGSRSPAARADARTKSCRGTSHAGAAGLPMTTVGMRGDEAPRRPISIGGVESVGRQRGRRGEVGSGGVSWWEASARTCRATLVARWWRRPGGAARPRAKAARCTSSGRTTMYHASRKPPSTMPRSMRPIGQAIRATNESVRPRPIRWNPIDPEHEHEHDRSRHRRQDEQDGDDLAGAERDGFGNAEPRGGMIEAVGVSVTRHAAASWNWVWEHSLSPGVAVGRWP